MSLVSNTRVFQLAATRSGAATWQAMLLPMFASHSSSLTWMINDTVRHNSSKSGNSAGAIHYSGSGFVEKPLNVLDSMTVARIKEELAQVDANSDGRYVQ